MPEALGSILSTTRRERDIGRREGIEGSREDEEERNRDFSQYAPLIY